jgi:hypothetical protein
VAVVIVRKVTEVEVPEVVEVAKVPEAAVPGPAMAVGVAAVRMPMGMATVHMAVRVPVAMAAVTMAATVRPGTGGNGSGGSDGDGGDGGESEHGCTFQHGGLLQVWIFGFEFSIRLLVGAPRRLFADNRSFRDVRHCI